MGENDWSLRPAQRNDMTCIDHGCGKPARWLFQGGGIGSYHCDSLPLLLILGPERRAALLGSEALLAEARAVLVDARLSVSAMVYHGGAGVVLLARIDALLAKLDAPEGP